MNYTRVSRLKLTESSINLNIARLRLGVHQEKHVREMFTPVNPTFIYIEKTGICRGVPIFLIFASKHILWVLVRTASMF